MAIIFIFQVTEGVFNKGQMYNSGFMIAMIFIFQVTEGVFNKGRMYNSGFVMAMADEDWDCVVLHDVDLVPETESNLYRCVAESPLHLSAGVDSLRYTFVIRAIPEITIGRGGGGIFFVPPHHHPSSSFLPFLQRGPQNYWYWSPTMHTRGTPPPPPPHTDISGISRTISPCLIFMSR